MERAVPRRVSICVQRAWQEVWKRDIRAVWDERGVGRSWRCPFGGGGAMLNALVVGYKRKAGSKRIDMRL